MSDIIEVKGQYYIRANASIADAGSRVLKHDDTFALFDRHGDIRPLGFEGHGVFHEGTRFVSRWKLGINEKSPLLLSSNVKEDNDFLVVDLTNPVLHLANGNSIPQGTIHLVRTIFLWAGEYFERIEVSSFALQPVRLTLELGFQADFVDLFEVRGTARKQRGRLLPAMIRSDRVVLPYEGLDRVVRQTNIHFSVPAEEISAERAVFQVDLAPQEQKCIDSRVSCLIEDGTVREETFDAAFGKVHAAYQAYRKDMTLVETTLGRALRWYVPKSHHMPRPPEWKRIKQEQARPNPVR